MDGQSARCFFMGGQSSTHLRSHTRLALTIVSLLCWPLVCGAQMVAPTPQPPGVPVTPEEAQEVVQEDWAIHAQGTLTWQLQPAFRAPYTGPQSLTPANNGRETIDATLYAGIRPWLAAKSGSTLRLIKGLGSATPLAWRGIPAAKPT